MMSPGWRESSAEHCVPDLGRGAALSPQAAERELALSNSMLELNTSDHDCRVVEDLEAQHRAVRDFTPRWSCSIMLFKYFDDRSLTRVQQVLSSGSSRAARCDAA
jgi:hypothetical protein